MVTENYERICRKLAEHQARTDGAVGTRAEGMEIRLWTWWIERSGGRVRVLSLRGRWQLTYDATRRIAQAVWGKDAVRAAELHVGRAAVLYALELDRGAMPERLRPDELPEPMAVRWYEARGLARGIGDQDGGKVSVRGRSLIYDHETRG